MEGLTHASVNHGDTDLNTEWSLVFTKIPCDLVVQSWLITHAQHEQGNLKSGIIVLAYAWICRFNSLCVIYIYLCLCLYTQYMCISFAMEKQPTSVSVGNYIEQWNKAAERIVLIWNVISVLISLSFSSFALIKTINPRSYLRAKVSPWGISEMFKRSAKKHFCFILLWF